MSLVYESDHFQVTVLKEGYCLPDATNPACFHADGSITLVQTRRHKVLVDTGGPQDRKYLVEALSALRVSPDDVDYVVCTHGHSDHVGNLNLFPDATHIVGWDICKGDLYTSHSFSDGEEYEIETGLVVMPTPGHTHNDVSLVVRCKKTIVIAGDLFESEADLDEASLWKDCSEDPNTQEQNRRKILELADIIVPGHGPTFNVKECYRTATPK